MRNGGLVFVLLVSAMLWVSGCGDDDTVAHDGGPGDSTVAMCGNGALDPGEECDEGAANSDSTPDACRTSCQEARCGDNVIDTGELCDDGPSNSDAVPDACRRDCTPARCGDGVVDLVAGETCDDGSAVAGDGCSPECQVEYCGNEIQDPGEECDDGNFVGGDGCGPTCLLERCGNGIVDLLVGEQCDDGNLASHDGCSSRCSIEVRRWRPFEPKPEAREGHGMTDLPWLNRVLLFGGDGVNGYLDDTWEFGDGLWERRATPAHPAARAGFGLVTDTQRDRALLFGGTIDVQVLNDLWSYDDTGWLYLTPAHAPPGRRYPSMAYDSARDRVVLFGGDTMSGFTQWGDTWEYDGTDWVQRTPAHTPPARMGAAMAYDPGRQVTVLFGGYGNSTYLGDLWEWDGTDWTQRTGMGGTVPSLRVYSAMVWDPEQGVVVLTGGTSAGSTLATGYTWNGTAWASLSGYDAGARREHGVAHHPGRASLLIFGGGNSTTTLGDTWEGVGASWDELDFGVPAPRREASLTFDEARGRAVLFGGYQGGSGERNDTWEHDGSRWNLITPTASPGARHSHAAAFDAARERTVIFGGCDYVVCQDHRLGETWEYDGTTWVETTPSGSPSARSGHVMAYDEAGDRIVLFGGQDTDYGGLADTWEYDGAAWTPVTTATQPTGRAEAVLVWDSAGSRLLLYGGQAAGSVPLFDLWAFDGVDWEEIPTPTPPVPSFSASAGFLGVVGSLVLYGGCGTGMQCDRFGSTWEFDGTTWLEVGVPVAPAGRAGAVMTCLGSQNACLLFGGETGTGLPSQETWRYELTSSVPDERCDNTADDDGDGLADCADPDCEGRSCGTGQVCASGSCQ